MLTRRGFLKGLLMSVAAGALVKNGIVQPEQRIVGVDYAHEPDCSSVIVFDMGAHTYRKALLELPGLRGYWSMDMPPLHANCRCVIIPVAPTAVRMTLEQRFEQWGTVQSWGEMRLYIPKHMDNSVIDQACAEVKVGRLSAQVYPSMAITVEQIQARIDEIAATRCSGPRGLLGPKRIAELWAQDDLS